MFSAGAQPAECTVWLRRVTVPPAALAPPRPASSRSARLSTPAVRVRSGPAEAETSSWSWVETTQDVRSLCSGSEAFEPSGPAAQGRWALWSLRWDANSPGMNDLLCAICLHKHPADTSCVAVTIVDGTAVCKTHALEIFAHHDHEEKLARYTL